MKDVTIKTVAVLEGNTGNITTVTNWLVQIGKQTLSRHTDETSATIAMDAANEERKQAVLRMRNARRSFG